jgi:DHA2 family multidrug resistance protein
MAELRYASGLFNLMRNLGGAIGIAVVNTWLGDNARIHVARFGEALGEAGRSGNAALETLAARIAERTPDAAQAALIMQGELAKVVGREALTLAFNDVFRVMAGCSCWPWSWPRSASPPPLAGAAPPPDAH